MKTPLLLVIAFTGAALAQGPLTPPSGADPSIGPVNALTSGGAPQATMKTLHQIEPRTAIAGGTSSMTLNQSGAYYLTGNITVANGDGIVIAASGVNLDLNGFGIMATAAAGTGIRFGAGIQNITVRNGSVSGGFAGGVRFVSTGPFSHGPLNVRVADLIVSDVTEAGIVLNKTDNNHVERCLVSATLGGGATGISATVVSDCSVQDGGIVGRIVKDCAVTGAGDFGIVGDVVQNCSSTATGTAIYAKCIVNSYGTGGGNSDVISAGVAQNVWGEGGGGSGDGLHATVVSNSYGKRVNDLSGASTGAGIEASVAFGSHGVGGEGYGIKADAILLGKGENISKAVPFDDDIPAVNGQVISCSMGLSTWGAGIKVGLKGALATSYGTTPNGHGILSESAAILGTSGVSGENYTGIQNPLGVVLGSSGFGYNAGISSTTVVASQATAYNGDGIQSELVGSSRGLGTHSGITTYLVHGSYGGASTGASILLLSPAVPLLKFDSN